MEWVINPSKCTFGATEVTFLGYNVSAEGIKTLESKVQAIKEFPQPKTVKELRRFLGMINFYRRFIPGAARMQAPLNNLLVGSVKGSHPVHIAGDSLLAFEKCKNSLSEAALLAHPDNNYQLGLVTDASDTALGAATNEKQGVAAIRLLFQKIKPNSTKVLALRQRTSCYLRSNQVLSPHARSPAFYNLYRP